MRLGVNCQTCLLLSQVQALSEENERLRRLHSTFHNLNDSFEYGEQPCKDFRPQRDGNGFGEWDNRHECPGCCGLRSFCVGCSTDHHGNGWENCASRAKAHLREAEEWREKMEKWILGSKFLTEEEKKARLEGDWSSVVKKQALANKDSPQTTNMTDKRV